MKEGNVHEATLTARGAQASALVVNISVHKGLLDLLGCPVRILLVGPNEYIVVHAVRERRKTVSRNG